MITEKMLGFSGTSFPAKVYDEYIEILVKIVKPHVKEALEYQYNAGKSGKEQMSGEDVIKKIFLDTVKPREGTTKEQYEGALQTAMNDKDLLADIECDLDLEGADADILDQKSLDCAEGILCTMSLCLREAHRQQEKDEVICLNQWLLPKGESVERYKYFFSHSRLLEDDLAEIIKKFSEYLENRVPQMTD